MLFDRTMKAALAVIGLGLITLLKPARRKRCSYERGWESGYQLGSEVARELAKRLVEMENANTARGLPTH
jgi:hypothetical protein